MRKSSFLYLFLSLFLVSCLGIRKVSEIRNLIVGEKFSYRISQDTDTQIGIFGKQKISTNKQIIDFDISVVNIWPDKSVDLELVYRAIEIWQVNEFRTISFNSRLKDKLPKSDVERIFHKMIGRKVYMTIDPQGEISHFTGALKMYDEIFKSYQDEALTDFKEVVKAQMGDQALKELFSSYWNVRVPGHLEIGQQWHTSDSLFTNMGGLRDNTYFFLGKTDSLTAIKVAAKIRPNPLVKGVKFGDVEMNFGLFGEENGRLELDNKINWPIEARTTKLLTGKMNMKTKIKGYSDISADMVVKIQTTVERLN